jgi:hypothetical protein
MNVPEAFGHMFLMVAALVGCLIGGVTATVLFVIRLAVVKPLGTPTKDGDRLSRRRWALCVSATALLITLHASGILFRAAFALHYPLFKRALADVSGMGPGTSAPHRWVGLFPVDTIHRGHDGEVGFGMGDDGITYDPTPVTIEWFFCPPDDGGAIFGNWRWTEAD